MLRRWLEGALQSVLGAFLFALIPGAAITYLARMQSTWTEPVFLGLCASALAIVSVVGIKLARRLPPKRLIPTIDNIETCVRTWLDNFRVAVKVDPSPTAYFRLLVTVDSGIKIRIGRGKEMSEYVLIRANIPPSPADMKHIEALQREKQNQLLLTIRLELARKNVAYSGLIFPGKEFNISKRVPIRESLTEHEFISAVEEIEAACHAVGTIFAMYVNFDALGGGEEHKLLTTS